MLDKKTALDEMRQFGAAYSYDTTYLETLLAVSGGAFAAFSAGRDMSGYRQELPIEAHFVARVTVMQCDDCGGCAQLNLRMAIEAGVERELLEMLIRHPEQLSLPLQDVVSHTGAVVRGQEISSEVVARLRGHYGEAAFGELAVIIAGSRLFPTLKRALMMSEACELLSLEY